MTSGTFSDAAVVYLIPFNMPTPAAWGKAHRQLVTENLKFVRAYSLSEYISRLCLSRHISNIKFTIGNEISGKMYININKFSPRLINWI